MFTTCTHTNQPTHNVRPKALLLKKHKFINEIEKFLNLKNFYDLYSTGRFRFNYWGPTFHEILTILNIEHAIPTHEFFEKVVHIVLEFDFYNIKMKPKDFNEY